MDMFDTALRNGSNKSRQHIELKDRLALSIGVAMVIIVSMSVSTVYAGGPRLDNDEAYADIPGAGECWVDGWDDGANGEYNSNRASECEDKGDQYNVAHGHATRMCIENNGEGAAGDCGYT